MPDPLNEKQRESLVKASETVRIDEESPNSPDAQYCLAEYFGELSRRFSSGFDPSKSLSPSLDEFLPPDGTFLVARLKGEPVGCGGFKRNSADAAYLKRMWIAPSARGLGLGKRLLSALEGHARSRGYRKAQLETNESLTEARQLYRKCGYREVAPFNDEHYAHYWFEKPLN
jgi:GNAT superfamily N-acetyltransferase